MLTSHNLARLGGVIATLSLIFLPLASCGDAQLTGIDIFQAEGSTGHKALLFITLVAAVLSIVIMQKWAHLVFGGIGIVAIALEYVSSINDPERTIQLREGAFLALLGFAFVFVAGLLTGAPATTAKSKRKSAT
jgi:hypothetical protein